MLRAAWQRVLAGSSSHRLTGSTQSVIFVQRHGWATTQMTDGSTSSPTEPRAAAARQFDAFLSYSHDVNPRLAPAVQNGLEQFAKPWYKLRALHVFRDAARQGG